MLSKPFSPAWHRETTLLLLTSFTLLFLSLSSSASAQATSTWVGGAGNWEPCPNNGGSALWNTCSSSSPAYPDGNYNAVIQGGPVTQSLGATIVNLSLGAGDSLIITPGYIGMTGTSIVNNGSITIGPGNGLFLKGSTILTLSGGGTVTMSDPNARLVGTPGFSPLLINQQTIQGQGNLGLGIMALTNQGTINANAGLLSVQPTTSGIVNTGTMEASSGSTLDIVYGLPAPFNNTGGTIQALNEAP